jgi:hypothetical protein
VKLRYLIPILFLTTSYELITDYCFVDKKAPLHFSGEYRDVGKAKFRTHSVRGSHAVYEDAHAFLYYSHYLNSNNSLSWKVGYSFLDFNWLKNPRFHESAYHFANASVGWVSTSVRNWRWILSTGASVDAQTFDFGQSGVYYGLMWGRYRYFPTLGMHIGWAGYAGVENGYLLPIIGIDWQAAAQCRVNAIFPINFSIEYYFNQYWKTTLEITTFGRPYRFPIRIHGGVNQYRNGIFEIYSIGTELDIKFNTGSAFWACFGGGWNYGGWILIKNHDNAHGKYYKFDGAPYIQGKLAFSF